MRGLRFIKLPKYRTFEYEPRFYDPVKEDLDRRVQLIESEMKGNDPDRYTQDAIGQRIRFARNRKSGMYKSTMIIRVAVAIMLIGFFGSIFFF
jgi:hypothetical protein